MSLPPVDPKEAEAWATRLLDGETLLWTGRPPARLLMFAKSDLLWVPMAGVMFVFGLYFFTPVLVRGVSGDPLGRVLMPLFAIVWLGAALYQFVGRFFVAARARATTRYALSDQRVLEARGHGATRLRSLRLTPGLSIAADGGDPGTVVFGTPPHRSGSMAQMLALHPMVRSGGDGVEFIEVAQAPAVFRAALEMQERAA